MGLFFELFVESGNIKKRREDLKAYFVSVAKIKTKFGTHSLQIYSVEKNIGITVGVAETGHTGIDTPEERKIATQVGHEFYKLLMDAPEFRYAMVGVEAGEWADGEDIMDKNFDGYFRDHGLVLNDKLKFITKQQQVQFKDGYSWIPYKGEIED